ncbi:hypothetical protein BKA57DRAFT_42925 [Linnemannia elongata]|nr:hypothetical protein BKA57DRAFT_42925 [Linnemannia elongata]
MARERAGRCFFFFFIFSLLTSFVIAESEGRKLHIYFFCIALQQRHPLKYDETDSCDYIIVLLLLQLVFYKRERV